MIISNPEYDLSKLRGAHYYWRSWSIVKFTPSFRAAFSGNKKNQPRPVYLNGRYGFEEVIEVSEDGKWHL